MSDPFQATLQAIAAARTTNAYQSALGTLSPVTIALNGYETAIMQALVGSQAPPQPDLFPPPWPWGMVPLDPGSGATPLETLVYDNAWAIWTTVTGAITPVDSAGLATAVAAANAYLETL